MIYKTTYPPSYYTKFQVFPSNPHNFLNSHQIILVETQLKSQGHVYSLYQKSLLRYSQIYRALRLYVLWKFLSTAAFLNPNSLFFFLYYIRSFISIRVTFIYSKFKTYHSKLFRPISPFTLSKFPWGTIVFYIAEHTIPFLRRI